MRTSSGTSVPDYSPPAIDFQDLVLLDKEASLRLVRALTEVGVVQITNVPKFGQARNRALENLAECLEADNANPVIPRITMADGSIRMSTGGATRKGLMEPMSHSCGEAAASLRSAITTATNQMFLAIDSVSATSSKRPLMSPHYADWIDLVRSGEHLEHLHSYSSAPLPHSAFESSPSELTPQSPLALDFHVDSGLLIAMTTGYYVNFPSNQVNGLFMKLPSAEVVRISIPDDSLLILTGEGASKWVDRGDAPAFRAVPHALHLDLPAGSRGRRNWYGKMFLPPADALVSQDPAVTYTDFHAAEIAQARGESPVALGLPAACPPYLPPLSSVPKYSPLWAPAKAQALRRLSGGGDDCTADQIYCWMRCMDIPASLNCSDPVCYDRLTEKKVPGSYMCPTLADTGENACVPACLPPSNSTSFCYGSGSSMLMQGFQSTWGKKKGNAECIALFVDNWTLDSSAKFGGACFGVFVLGLLVQLFAKLRLMLSSTKQPLLPAKYQHWAFPLSVALYGVNMVLGYFAMLVAMTYSVELFCFVCCGLIVGYTLVHQSKSSGEEGNADLSADPCCVDEPLLQASTKLPPKKSNTDHHVISPINQHRQSIVLAGRSRGRLAFAATKSLPLTSTSLRRSKAQ
eukprot:gene28931-34916_t